MRCIHMLNTCRRARPARVSRLAQAAPLAADGAAAAARPFKEQHVQRLDATGGQRRTARGAGTGRLEPRGALADRDVAEHGAGDVELLPRHATASDGPGKAELVPALRAGEEGAESSGEGLLA